jgi:hypothetical protein
MPQTGKKQVQELMEKNHTLADCEHPLLCLLGPGIVSQETAISGSFQQILASVCNGVSVWKLIMGWIPGYGSL